MAHMVSVSSVPIVAVIVEACNLTSGWYRYLKVHGFRDYSLGSRD